LSTTVSLSFTSRAYQGEADIPAIADLLNLCLRVDDEDHITTVEGLQEHYRNPEVDAQRNVRLWHASTGLLVAISGLRLQPGDEHDEPEQTVYLGFSIHPDMRSSGLDAQIMAWSEQHLQHLLPDYRGAVKLYSGVQNNQRDRIELLERYGFQATRQFYRMSRALTDDLPDIALPEGFTVRTVDAVEDAERWVEMFNQTFIDHWHHRPMTLEQFHYCASLSDYDADLDWVAIAPDGNFAGFCVGHIDWAENAQLGRDRGWISLLGTRRGYRRLGLGRAMLVKGLRQLQAKGLTTAMLGVDSENPSKALHLYESLGFQQVAASTAYVKHIMN
jgi:mycothiol synthase